ncbi:DUF6542 domain-containing protein [Nocardia arthritidis]|uniref:DUF6542 domain-containing protein n=1 Tax=Nocardia arthritidis TaxID=228602 RepID=A0A6G9YQM7_9NOCA|nr:DUF6542 domain-containing protein [Nocardia arthritidis]QIS15481.1 hypothetical protein F5544_38290 [Nocardia arthritidis]
MAASQSARSRVPAPQRSILPSVPGLPVGAAILIAVVCTFVGFVIDARGGGDDLTYWFAGFYIVGCVAAVLVVRYRGLFTTMVLPPLLLFIAVPLAYERLAGHTSTSLRDILFNLAIPLVHRFPLMALATAIVVVLGIVRIVMNRREGGDTTAKATKKPRSRSTESLRRAASKRGRADDTDDETEAPRRRRRPQPEIDDPDTVQHLPRVNRRPQAEVADGPPRVAGRGYPRDARTRTGRPVPPPRPDLDQPRSTVTRARGDIPPHPQPNVRYRDRDAAPRQPNPNRAELRPNRRERRDPNDYDY